MVAASSLLYLVRACVTVAEAVLHTVRCATV